MNFHKKKYEHQYLILESFYISTGMFRFALSMTRDADELIMNQKKVQNETLLLLPSNQ